MIILTFNSGSSSLKYAVFRGRQLKRIRQGNVEGINKTIATHASAAREIVSKLRRSKMLSDTIIVGHRFVHGGESFSRPTRLTKTTLARLSKLSKLAPLHNPPALEVMRAVKRLLPAARQVVAFDTSFFSDLPDYEQWYPLPLSIQKKNCIRRFGFHGLSHEAAVHAAAQKLNRPWRTLNLVTVHLGAGCSVVAVNKGRAVATSMGFTPLEGLPMATRSGSLDPEVILTLEDHGWSRSQVRDLLNHRSGWYGLTGFRDFRDVLAAAGRPVARGWRRPHAVMAQRRMCRLATDLFTCRVKKEIAGSLALLGHVDAIVFTGAIGNGNPSLRRAITAGLGSFGQPRILAVPTDEEVSLARACLAV